MIILEIKNTIYLLSLKKILKSNILFFRIIQKAYKFILYIFNKLYLTLLRNDYHLKI